MAMAVSVRIDPDRAAQLDGPASALLLFLLPIVSLSPIGSRSVTVAVLAECLLFPLIVTGLRGQRVGQLMAGLMLASLLTAPLLSSLSIRDVSRGLDSNLELRLMLLLVRCTFILLTVLWARQHLAVPTVALWFGLGAFVQGVLDSATFASANPWKYALAWPAAVMLLAITDGRRRLLTVLALLLMVSVSIQRDFRSFAAEAVLAMVLYVWRSRSDRAASRRRIVFVLIASAAIAYTVYLVGTHLALNGTLGEQLQLTTRAQTANGRTLILGGRSESTVALKMFKERPQGFGPGVQPNLGDVQIGKTGLADVAVATDSFYVDRFLFGDGINLHSVTSDLWINFGVLGLAFALLMWARLVFGLGQMLASRVGSGLLLFTSIVALWDLAFSPMAANMPQVVFSVALLISAATSSSGKRPSDGHGRSRTEKPIWRAEVVPRSQPS
jgi:hypothetical protein